MTILHWFRSFYSLNMLAYCNTCRSFVCMVVKKLTIVFSSCFSFQLSERCERFFFLSVLCIHTRWKPWLIDFLCVDLSHVIYIYSYSIHKTTYTFTFMYTKNILGQLMLACLSFAIQTHIFHFSSHLTW